MIIVAATKEKMILNFAFCKDACFKLSDTSSHTLQYIAAVVIVKTIESNIATFDIQSEIRNIDFIFFKVYNSRKESTLKIMELLLPNKIKCELIELRSSFYRKVKLAQISEFLDKFLFIKQAYSTLDANYANNAQYIAIRYPQSSLLELGIDIIFINIISAYTNMHWSFNLGPQWCSYPFASDIEYKCYVINNLHQNSIC